MPLLWPRCTPQMPLKSGRGQGWLPVGKPSVKGLHSTFLAARCSLLIALFRRAQSYSATLRLFKVESGINGLLPTSWVPSIYSVSRLSRLRSALGRLLHFAFDSP